MNAKDAIRTSIAGADMVVDMYLEDLTDAELLVRPVPGTNHIAWQLGHLIQSENDMIEMVSPGVMPKLPEGFKAKYGKETAEIDDPKAFHTKAEYLKLLKEQRAGSLVALDKVNDTDLDKPSPEALRAYFPTVASIFTLQGSHRLMHAGPAA